MDDIRMCFMEKFIEITEIMFDRESIMKLLCHEFFIVANGDNFTTRNFLDFGCMGVSNLSASYDSNFKHSILL